MTDTYKTIRSHSRGVFRDRGSRFIADAWPVKNSEQIKDLVEKTRKEFHDARHHCFAWVLGADRSSWRVSDDGEPSGTAGKPILGQINSFGLTDILIIVTRYFGGTLLGTGGLINAYREAAGNSLSNSEIIELSVRCQCTLTFPYRSLNDVMNIIKEEKILYSDQEIDLECRLKADFSISDWTRIEERFSRVDGVIIIPAGQGLQLPGR